MTAGAGPRRREHDDPAPKHPTLHRLTTTESLSTFQPIGRHRYFFKLYALDAALGDHGAATKADLECVIQRHLLAEAVLMGTYQKGD